MNVSELSNQYIASFDPKEYLQECYSIPDDEFRFGIQFLINTLKKLPPNLFVLEFGGGPTLHSVAALAPYAHEIHFADFVPASLKEVQLWLNNNPTAYNWHPFIEIILEKEGITVTPETIAQREAEMRKKVTKVMGCNALSNSPLGENANQYNLVLAPYCTDVAASTVIEWTQVIKNVSSLVAPGGWLLVGITTGATLNTVGKNIFSCVDLTHADIQNGFTFAGFNPDTFYLEHCPVPTGREYTGLTNAIAQKPITS